MEQPLQSQHQQLIQASQQQQLQHQQSRSLINKSAMVTEDLYVNANNIEIH